MTIVVIVLELLLPAAAAMTGAFYSWPVTAALCAFAAAAAEQHGEQQNAEDQA